MLGFRFALECQSSGLVLSDPVPAYGRWPF